MTFPEPLMPPLFPHLFSPVRIGPIDIRNRILSTGHMTCMLAGGLPTDQFVAYHEARAHGGCGLIVTESAAVHPTSNAYNIMLFKDEVVDALSRTADAVKPHGAVLFGQLGHGGRERHAGTDGSRPAAFGPSALATERFHVMPRAMSTSMIADIVAAYGRAAGRYREAGYDGLEIMSSHGLLPAQFLNAESNRRSDDYGGSRDNRMRFLREAITSIRAEVGREMALGIRISGDELNHQGLTPDEVVAICAALDADGQIDFIDVCGGSMTGLGGSVHVVPPMNLAPGYLAPISARVKTAVASAVFVAGRINDPRAAERILADGQADMCGMTRAQICDPDMAAKAARNAVDDIRACIGCNQACIDHMQHGYPISCLQHPETGRERRYRERGQAERALRVVVVGGGPAGMKAAAVAAERGHRVSLHEQDGELGGQARLARQLPGRDEFGGIVTNLAREMERAGVELHLNDAVDRVRIQALAPDAVVIATGATPHLPVDLMLEGAHVLHATQVLEGANVGASVVIADWRCDWVGMGIAERLARDGCRVRLAVNGYMAGQNVQQYTRDRWAGDLHRLGVEVIPYVRLAGADEDTVYLQHTTSGEAVLCEGVDTLVAATGSESATALEAALDGWHGELWIAGDALAPRTCEEAVLEGLKVGTAIGGADLEAIDAPSRLRPGAPHRRQAT